MNRPYSTKGSLVKGQGYSYNLTSKIDAERLCNTLNQYEHNLTIHKNTNTKLDKIEKQIIALQMDIAVVVEGIKNVKEVLDEK